MTKHRPTLLSTARALHAAGFTYHSTGKAYAKDRAGKRYKAADTFTGDKLTDETRAALAMLSPWVQIRTSRSQYAPELCRPIILLLTARHLANTPHPANH
jgi:hypothetical protein